MTTVEIADTTLFCERSGHGPATVFVHGMCGNADVWAEQAERVADRATAVRYDRRGHTRSQRGDAPVSAGRHADDAAALIRSLDLAPCLLVGSSSGAVIALDVALRHGDLLRGVVLTEPPLFSLDPVAGRTLMAELVPAIEQALTDGGPPAAIDAFFAMICPGLWSSLDEVQRDRYRANAAIGLEDLRAPSLELSAADLSAVTVPVLVIAGDRSHAAFRSISRRLAAALGDARFVELSGSGHVTYAEQPEAFARALAAFAAELDRRSGVSS